MADFYRLLDKKEPIWVTNHTGGKIIMELRREGHKKPYTARIPPIKDYPMNLGSLIPYPIMEYDHSTVFQWIQNRSLKVWDPDAVEEMYGGNEDLKDAVYEMLDEANAQRKFETKDIGLSVSDGALDRAKDYTGKQEELGDVAVSIGANAPMTVSREGGAVTLQMAAAQQRVPTAIAELVATLQADGSQQASVLVKLKTMDRELITKDALGFIIDNCGKYSNVQKWARNKLADLSGGKKKTKKEKKRLKS